MTETTMHTAHISQRNNQQPVEAFWATAQLPIGFRGEIPVTLIVDDQGMRIVFPSKGQRPAS